MGEPTPAAASEDWADEVPAAPEAPAPDEDVSPDVGGLEGEDSATVKVVQADPSTPYQSASSFEEVGLSDELLRAVYALKFERPSKIQASSLPLILSASGEYKHLIAQGHNGSGKTACFVLAMLSRIDDTKKHTQALCLVPTRELARQIADIVESLGQFTQAKVCLAVPDGLPRGGGGGGGARSGSAGRGGGNASRGRSGSPVDVVKEQIVIGTPGKIQELFKRRAVVPTKVKIFVLDEADQMVSHQGMGDQTLRVKSSLPRNVQCLLFSATYADDVRDLAVKLAPGANQISIQRETLSLDKIQQYYMDTGSADRRFNLVSDIYDALQLGQTVVFVTTRREAQALTARLRDGGHTVSVLTGGEMTPQERDRVIDQFRQGTTRVLVTTNVLSRGVDIPAITAVINYDLPVDVTRRIDPEVYLHRIGRTGRFGRKGIAINLVYDDKTRGMIKTLETYYNHPMAKVDSVETLEERIKAL